MLKKSLAALPRSLVLALLCAGAMAQASAQSGMSRIGFVYTERLMTESKLAKAADAKLQSEFSKRQKQLDDAVQKYKVSREKFDDEAPKLSDVDRTKRTRELLDMEKDVQRMQREYNEDLFQRKNEERAAIAQKAYKLIEQVAEQEHLDVVLQEAIWTSPRIDITDRILKLLDK
ncbi:MULTISPECIES: OmpH family outer membrane protein [Massilia]|jgi:outer membrane protein|uniref:OmpH family outer membrane protein n=2 Tax=Massilia TaxID=149698 RepID=A0A7X3FWZ4_9BURK|nr:MULTISPECIES: OmpH family outer membrane protein [Telluria group]MDN4041001.1 OmpH family outer membrane protein [Massilia sp. YIM B02787]MVW59512.1 OmpH family outer membrane protein [Telluria cellulosilytica]